MKIKVHRDKCIGAAACVVLAEDVFELDEDNIAVVKPGKERDAEKILEAAKACPTLAIELIDEDSGETVFPTEN